MICDSELLSMNGWAMACVHILGIVNRGLELYYEFESVLNNGL